MNFYFGNRYDPRKFVTSPSIVTYIPHDQNLGNVISAYLILLWINLEHGYSVYVDKASHNQLKFYFKNVDQTPVKVLEESLCDWDEFGFQKFEGSITNLGDQAWSQGKAIRVIIFYLYSM